MLIDLPKTVLLRLIDLPKAELLRLIDLLLLEYVSTKLDLTVSIGASDYKLLLIRR